MNFALNGPTLTHVPVASLKSSATRPSNRKPRSGSVVVGEPQRIAELVESLFVKRRLGQLGLAPVAGGDARALDARLELAGVGDELHLDPWIWNADYAGVARALGDADRRWAGLGRTERSHHGRYFAHRLEPETLVALADMGSESGPGVAETPAAARTGCASAPGPPADTAKASRSHGARCNRRSARFHSGCGRWLRSRRGAAGPRRCRTSRHWRARD